MLLCAYIREVKVKKVYFPFEATTPMAVPIGDYQKNLCLNRPYFNTEEHHLPGEQKCLCLKAVFWNLYLVECWMDPAFKHLQGLEGFKLGQVDWEQNHWNIVCKRPRKLSSPVSPSERDYQQSWNKSSVENPQRWSPAWVLHCTPEKKG